MLNNVVLIGRLTKDPELRYTPSGVAVATFTLAVNRTFAKEGQQQADFIPVITFNKQAENCANYISKGRMVAIEGRIQVRTYEDKQGQKRWATEVIANNVRFLDYGKDKGQELGQEVEFDEQDIPF